LNRKLLPIVVVAVAFAAVQLFSDPLQPDRAREAGPAIATPKIEPPADRTSEIDRAFHDRRSNVQVAGRGVVANILQDDNDGSRHQRFILTLPSGRTLLVAHNIDLAPRVEPLDAGDTIAFAGEYEWNSKGGVLHWTHRDPAGRHPGGWLERKGRRFE
jgi:Protein of unknown function (DUF3465)